MSRRDQSDYTFCFPYHYFLCLREYLDQHYEAELQLPEGYSPTGEYSVWTYKNISKFAWLRILANTVPWSEVHQSWVSKKLFFCSHYACFIILYKALTCIWSFSGINKMPTRSSCRKWWKKLGSSQPLLCIWREVYWGWNEQN